MPTFPALRNAVRRLVEGQRGAQPSNLSLQLDRLTPKIGNKDERKTIRDEVLGLLGLDPEEIGGRKQMSPYSAPHLRSYRAALGKWEHMLQDQGAQLVQMELESPLLCGSGEKTVHEFGFYLHRLWGTPIIPGSSLKGIGAAIARECGGDFWQAGASGAEELFGTHKKSGLASFLEAWWIPNSDDCNPFAAEIVNPHYLNYYEGKDWPHGMENPRPFHFPVVRAGERFLIAVAGPADWAERALDIVLHALVFRGIGAKTRLGWGRFAVPAGRSLQPPCVDAAPAVPVLKQRIPPSLVESGPKLGDIYEGELFEQNNRWFFRCDQPYAIFGSTGKKLSEPAFGAGQRWTAKLTTGKFPYFFDLISRIHQQQHTDGPAT